MLLFPLWDYKLPSDIIFLLYIKTQQLKYVSQ